MAAFTITNYTDVSATIRVTGLTAGDEVYVVCRLYSDTSDTTYAESFFASSSILNIFITGLSPSTYYAVNVRHNPGGTGENMVWLGRQTFTTKDPRIIIDPWVWTASNGTATAAQTSLAYSAITSNGRLSDFSHLVWNDMCAKVLEIVEALGYSWSNAGGHLNYNDTLMTSNDTAMTALRFNSLRYNIGRLYSNEITPTLVVSKGEQMLGSQFIRLMQAVNNWIEII